MNDIWLDSSNVGSQILEGWNVMITEVNDWKIMALFVISGHFKCHVPNFIYYCYVGASTVIVKIWSFAYDVEGRRCRELVITSYRLRDVDNWIEAADESRRRR